MKIELRNDGWWDAGKDEFPDHYKAKQDLKRALEAIGEQLGKRALERALARVEVSGLFEGQPYINASSLEIQTQGWPGECYLGSIKR